MPLLLRAALAACLGLACSDTSQPHSPGEPAALERGSPAPLRAGAPFLVEDLSPGTQQPYYLPAPGAFAAVGNTAFFVADNGVTGSELWKVEGTPPAIALVGDLLPGAASSAPSHLTAMNGKLYFAAATAVGSRAPSALWSSDGTAQGTRPLLAIGAPPSFITQKDGTLYFEAPSPGASSGFELWRSDGTPQGTVRLKALASSQRGYSSEAAWVGDTLFFSVHDNAQGHTLWKSDGTAAGTVLVEDVLPSTSLHDRLFNFTVANGVLLFVTRGVDDWRYQLWRSDGTEAGTFPLLSLQYYSGGSRAEKPVVAGSAAYFPQWDAQAGLELWKTDGTLAGTARVADIVAGATDASPLHLAALGQEIFFIARSSGWELWKSNGTAAGTARVPLPAGWHVGGEYGPPMAASPGAVFFVASHSTLGSQLWKSDGTSAGTVQVTTQAYPGLSSPTPRGWQADALYFTTFDDRLWRSDGTTAGTSNLGPIHSLQNSSSPRDGVNLGGSLLFAVGSATSGGLATSNGTAAGTFSLTGSNPVGLQPADGQLFFWQHGRYSDTIESFFLTRTDGSAGGSTTLKTFTEERDNSDRARPPSSTLLNGKLFFAMEPTERFELPAIWKSDGTAAGTVSAATVRSGSFVLTPRLLTTVENRLFFAAGFGFGSDALWTSDGTEAGTRKLKDFTINSYSSWPLRYLTALGGTAILWADTQAEGPALWKSDGTTAGTVLLARLAANDQVRPGPETTAVLNGELYFATAPLQEPPQLWKTNGQQVVRVATFSSINGGPAPSHFTALNGALLFWAHDAEHGYELWRTDGTTAGTVRVKDINPGPASAVGTPGSLVALGPGGPLLFAASDGASGLELWQTDGTAAGTVRLADIAPGPASSSPASLAVAGPFIYFQAWSADTGTELWALSRPVLDTEPPQLTCPAAQVAEATSQYGATVHYSPATATDSSGARPVVRYSTSSGKHFSLGTNTVTVTALDDWGNSATCTFPLTVRDTTPPTITCPGPKSLEANTAGGTGLWNAPTATARDIASFPTVSTSPASHSILPVGTTQVRATATDGAGLTASCTFPVTVTDTTAPVLYDCPTALSVEATRPEGAAVPFTLPRTYDVVGPPEVSVTPAVGSLFPLGRTEVAITARDGAGNEARCAFPVTVVDSTPPSIICPPGVQVVATDSQGAAVLWPAAAAQDSVSETRVSYSPEPGSLFPIGTHSVTATASDASGNSLQCSFTVQVTRPSQPVPPGGEPEPEPEPNSGCGCGQSGGQGAALLGLGLLAMLSLPRRRPWTRAT